MLISFLVKSAFPCSICHTELIHHRSAAHLPITALLPSLSLISEGPSYAFGLGGEDRLLLAPNSTSLMFNDTITYMRTQSS